MLELEDLPRLESLSPVKDMENYQTNLVKVTAPLHEKDVKIYGSDSCHNLGNCYRYISQKIFESNGNKMISNKKSYAMKMLQLALALSLLHVDPDNYLQELQLRNWDSQLELRHGDGWELEMLRAVPMVEYPYANRKTMIPLIEDLVRFDREHAAHQYNVTAYLLNVQNDSANQTAALQDLQATTNTAATTTTSTTAGAAALEHVTTVANSPNNTVVNLGHVSPELELYLNSDQFSDQRSVWEQNLADLNDFNDLPGMQQYSNLPLKDVQIDNNFVDLHLESFLAGFRNENSSTPITTIESENEDPTALEGAVALNGTFPNPSDGSIIKTERTDEDEDIKENIVLLDEVASCSSATYVSGAVCIKKEEKLDETKYDVDLSPFISQVELTKEESEIVEVLWKQDVDLGYSLNPVQLANASEASGSAANALKATHFENNSNDDIEKLKALEELKEDKSKNKNDDNNVDNIGDEWAGIPFTIDNETGEYIRLPLDELLNDVLQFAELAGVNNEIDDDSIASTSKAAAAATNNNSNNNNNNNKVKTDDDNNIEEKLKKNNYSNNNQGEFNNNNTLDDDEVPQSEIEVSSLPSPLFDLDDEAKKALADFDKMIQSAPFHHPHPHHHAAHHHHHHHHAAAAAAHRGLSGASVQTANYPTVGGGVNSAFQRQTSTGFHHGHHQGRMPLSRGVSMEQRLQDIASLFNPIPSMGVVGGVSEMPPYPHYPTHHYGYQTAAPQHAQYPPPPPPPHHPHGHHAMLHPNASLGDICSTQPHYGHNLGSAVSSSMHLTNASHEADAAVGGAYKMEHEMMYYSNTSSDLNHTSDGFINSILNDEDLHLMDMNVNDSFCRMVDVNNSTSNNSSVLGISTSGHGSSAGSNTGAVSMNSAGGNANTAGMTTDLMAGGAQGGTDRLDASSDSAVSSMGSERVPSLSDGEWGEGSDSAQDYHQSKYGGPYDYSYNNASGTRLNDGSRQPPVAQKKHQMFGKRYLNEQSPLAGATAENATLDPAAATANLIQGPAHNIKYEYEQYPTIPNLATQNHDETAGAMGPAVLKDQHHGYDLKYGGASAMGVAGGYSLDFSLRTPRTPHEIMQHNHTYTLPQGTGSIPRPQQRDKKLSTSSSKSGKSSGTSLDEHMTRDEKRARALNIPIPVIDIINLPMDEFNERLSKYDLNENQLSLIRDIRRRGKNKVAAQNCRKRKLDQILSLEDEVKEVVRRKQQLQQERDSLTTERKRISSKFSALHRHIFQYLRDADGNPCSPSEYSLQQAADGSIFLLPRDSNNKTDNSNSGGGVAVGTGAGASTLNHHNIAAMHQTPQAHHHQSMLAHTQNHHSHTQPQQQQQQQQQQTQQQHHHHHHAQHQHQHHPTQQKD